MAGHLSAPEPAIGITGTGTHTQHRSTYSLSAAGAPTVNGSPQSRAVVAPDVFVVLGADNADRSTYRLWVEPKAPDFVLEITSRSTRREDQVSKRALYRSLGVREYWQFDPTNDYLEPPLQGLELIEGEYRPLPALASAVLGLELRLTERGLRFHDPQTGEDLSNLGEIDAARQRAEQAQQRAEQERQEAESRLAQEAAARRQEAAARQAAEARVAELEDLLRQAGGSDSSGDR